MNLKRYEDTRTTGTEVQKVPLKKLLNRPLIVQVADYKNNVKTSYHPNGTEMVLVHIIDIESGRMAKDQAWWNGALIDALKDKVGDLLVCRMGQRTANSNFKYFVIDPPTEADVEAAQKLLDNNPDILQDTTPETTEQVSTDPFASKETDGLPF